MRDYYSKTRRETSGIKDLRLDHFGDVKRALSEYLMRNCTHTQKASEQARMRVERRKAGNLTNNTK